MHKTKIEWTDFAWNPITGCKHGCWYCYASKLYKRFGWSFEPQFHPERLYEPHRLKKPSKIFACTVADIFAPWTPTEWRDQVIASILTCPVKHSFQLLTKNPELIPDIEFPENVWVGTTITGECGDERNFEFIERVKGNRFVSFEPLLAEVEPLIENVDWVIVGRLTGARKHEVKFGWLGRIMNACEMIGVPLFMKNNLKKEFPNIKLIQQFPEGMVK